MIILEIPGLPKLPNETLYRHWRVKQTEAKKWKGLVVNAVRFEQNLPAIPFKLAKVSLTRFSAREPDCDNLAASFKHVLDGLVEAGVIIDDKPSYIGQPIFLWQKAKQREGKIKVVVEEIKMDKAG